MAPPLQAILKAELARGNTIADFGDWPPDCRLFVMLSRPFAKRYRLAPEVAYERSNDPRHWRAEYRWRGRTECLACGF